MSYEDFEAVFDVHLRGAFHVVRQAFPLMCDAGYGRIVLTSSIGGLYGNHEVANYAIAKAGVIGLSNVAAMEGAAEGVKSNVIVPAAVTRMAEGIDTSAYPPMGRSLWRPWSAGSRTKPVPSQGRSCVALAGRVARAVVAETPGVPAVVVHRRRRRTHGGDPRRVGSRRLSGRPDGHGDHIRYSFAMATQGASVASQGPLAGVRVVDLTAMVMGPYCTQIMADMGADVIKVEPPEGDNTRYISVGPAPGMSGVYINVNRASAPSCWTCAPKAANRAAGADPNGRRVHPLDAVKGGRQTRLRLRRCRRDEPPIVYTNCYGYGRRGPNRDLPAYDDTIQAECGLPAVQEQLTGEANYVGTIIADKVAGLTALYATMMALFHRERTGEGQEVEVSMFETMASFMLVEHANGAMFDPPLGPAVYPRTVAPNRRPYRTKDGYIAALIYNDKHWNAFIDAVRPAWATELYATLELRANDIDTVYGLVAQTMLERTTDEWLALFRELETPRRRSTHPTRCSTIRT